MTGFDVVVVGGGHAGVEAATAAARVGARVGLVTFDAAHIGAMSCNPAIGGLGKGHLVREVDALGGVIARAADAAAIHHRLLNASKGAAVQGPRVQADRRLFAAAVRRQVAALPGIAVLPGDVVDLVVDGGRVSGVRLADGTRIAARAVVLATGTFLGGRLFRGEERGEGGRVDERAATRLGQRLRDLALPIARLKTGTPPRIDGRTIDWARLERQPSDGGDWTMSRWTGRRRLPQLACAITRTDAATHAIIADALDRSPLFTGAIDAVGPRYCPSIEDKIHRFADRDGHQIFLEPEGLDTPLVYPNGISTSLPADIQAALVGSIAGLEAARIVVPGYAVEYDHVDPRALDATLAVRALPGLWCAGQINGTTGYEEAAGQGLVAGANAALMATGRAPMTLDRATSYLGVMIDDLTLQGVSEPYRMLTARAEWRLRLRADNALTRLGETALGTGLVAADARGAVAMHLEAHAAATQTLDQPLDRDAATALGLAPAADGLARSVGDALRHGIGWDAMAHVAALPTLDAMTAIEIAGDAHYAPYVARQTAELAALAANEAIAIDPGFDYRAIASLSTEMVERLARAAPATLGQAGRVPGVTPTALAAILVHHRLHQRGRQPARAA